MSTTTPHTTNTEISFWRKSLNWLQAFEEAMDYDPAQASINQLNREVAELTGKVRNLESQLDERQVNKH